MSNQSVRTASDLSLNQARCRIKGHNWHTIGIEFSRECITETLECMDCITIRVADIDRGSGLILRSSYRYQSDYQVSGGVAQADRGLMRLRVLIDNENRMYRQVK